MNWLLLRNSLLVSGLTMVLAGAFGFVAALWLAGLGKNWRVRISALAIFSLALPPFLVANCWLDLLGQNGLWTRWLPFNVVSLGGTVWILSLLLWPITLFAVLSAWQRLEPAQLESDMAVTGWALIRGLLLPVARTPLAQAAVLTFVLALSNFAVPAILQVKVFPAEIWVRFNTTFDTLGALRMSWPLVLAPLVLLVWFGWRDLRWPLLEGPAAPRLLRQQLGTAWFWSSGAISIALCFLSLGVPLLELVSLKRTWTELPGALAAGQVAVWNSFSLATAAATVVLGLSLIFATRPTAPSARGHFLRIPLLFGAHRSLSPQGTSGERGSLTRSEHSPAALLHEPKSKSTRKGLLSPTLSSLGGEGGSSVFNVLVWLPLLMPGVLLGMALIFLFNRPWLWVFYQSAGIVILAFVIRYAALGWHAVRHASRSVDRDLIDDAKSNGATRWQLLRFVQWPQISRSAAAAWYIVFLLCLWDVESMILVLPPGGETLALRIFNLLHYGHNAQVNALCLTLLALAVTPLLAWKVWDMVSSRPSPFTHHASRITLLMLSTCLLTSCGPKSSTNESSLDSRLFSSVQIFGHRGVGVGELNKPRSVAVDLQNDLYAVDMTGRVQKFSSKGAYLLSWQLPQTDLGKPKGMSRDRDGGIIVVEPHYQRLNFYSPDGKLLSRWGEKGTNAGQFMLPRAVAVNSHGEIYVSEYGAVERVQRFDTSNSKSHTRTFLNEFGHPGTGPGEFNRPEGLWVNSEDHLFVADSCNHRIQIFSREGKFIRTYGHAGSGKGELSYPYDICVDTAGRQYVCEFGNSRIQVFDRNDQPIEIIGGPGAAPGRFNNPWGVALDSAGNLYVADSQNHRVQKLICSPKSNAQNPKSNWMTELGMCWALDFGHWTLD